ncbi:MAG: 50S ribosomal protein L29 [Acidimicrobiales bacterium]|nr:50S ribosomal protein L29 [Acidimicrobiales bacterium]
MADAVTEQSDAELLESLADAKKELFNLRFQLATGQLANPARIREIKKGVARVRTEQRRRQLAETGIK